MKKFRKWALLRSQFRHAIQTQEWNRWGLGARAQPFFGGLKHGAPQLFEQVLNEVPRQYSIPSITLLISQGE